ncbi:hypothetical protein GCM10007880_65650 [Mesorhizobium amorphae]|nr:hypothetical protein GCM10007880_65650 [Mesorhizobium amorphae]
MPHYQSVYVIIGIGIEASCNLHQVAALCPCVGSMAIYREADEVEHQKLSRISDAG